MFPLHYKEYEAIFIPNQTPPGEQNPESPESPGNPREPGSWDPDSRSKADPPAVTRAAARALDSGFWPARCMCSKREAEVDPRLPEGPLAWFSLHCWPQ